jgi:hypothetical protein
MATGTTLMGDKWCAGGSHICDSINMLKCAPIKTIRLDYAVQFSIKHTTENFAINRVASSNVRRPQTLAQIEPFRGQWLSRPTRF